MRIVGQEFHQIQGSRYDLRNTGGSGNFPSVSNERGYKFGIPISGDFVVRFSCKLQYKNIAIPILFHPDVLVMVIALRFG